MYIHGGISLKHAGTCVAPRTRRTAHGTRTHADPSHARRCADADVFWFCAAVQVEVEREPVEGLTASPARSPSIGEEAKYSKGVAKMTLAAGQGAARAVSERGPLGYSRQGVCRCAVEDMESVGTEEGERPVECGEVVRAKALGPSRKGEKSPRPEAFLRGLGAHPPSRLATRPPRRQQRRELRNGAWRC